MHLEEGLHAEFQSQFMESLEPGCIEDAGHEEDRIGTEGPRLADLVLADDEILPKHRLGDLIADGTEPLHASAEVTAVGEDREGAHGTALLVGQGCLRDIFGTHRTDARGAFLDFRDQPEALFQGPGQGAHRRGIGDHPAQVSLGAETFRPGNLLPHVGKNPVKDGGCGWGSHGRSHFYPLMNTNSKIL